jgi:hypothetical protein
MGIWGRQFRCGDWGKVPFGAVEFHAALFDQSLNLLEERFTTLSVDETFSVTIRLPRANVPQEPPPTEEPFTGFDPFSNAAWVLSLESYFGLIDYDGDGRAYDDDACPDTPAGGEVDTAGCSQQQFCNGFPDSNGERPQSLQEARLEERRAAQAAGL